MKCSERNISVHPWVMASISFLSVSADKDEKCLICDKEFKKQKSNSFTPANWDAFKVRAEKRALIYF